jgi:hypothetical protein
MDLKPHKFATIGLKKLSLADTGLSEKSNQTHIGLFENTLHSIDDLHLVNYCKLVYNDSIKRLLCLLDYIENPDGSFRSPKIRKGSERELIVDGVEINSVVRELRDVIYKTDTRKNWYLIWYVNEDEHLVFVLFEFRSKLFDLLSSKLGGIGSRHQFDSNSVNYDRVINCLKSVIKIN